jgi:hypothetical protein
VCCPEIGLEPAILPANAKTDLGIWNGIGQGSPIAPVKFFNIPQRFHLPLRNIRKPKVL